MILSALAKQPRSARLAAVERFTESNRYFRGRVVDALRELSETGSENGIELRELGVKVRKDFSDQDLPWLYGVVQELNRDGLACIAEERPAYDTVGSDVAATIRVRLP